MSTLVLSSVIIAVLGTVYYIYKYISTKRPIFFVNLALVYAAVGLGYALISGIQAPIEFKKEKEYRYSFVIQNLKDIRKAELAYKDQFNVFTGDFKVLIDFVKYDSLKVTRRLGALPDTLSESMAVERGLSITSIPTVITKEKAKELLNVVISEDLVVNDKASAKKALEIGFLIRDTVKLSVLETVFNLNYNVDSLEYVPFSNKHAKFKLAAGEIETASKVKVQLFEAVDTDPFDPNDVKKVGSLTEATNNAGNWE